MMTEPISGADLSVLVVTNMYPVPAMPMFGIFVAEQVNSLRRRGLRVDVLFVNGAADRREYLHGFDRVRRAVGECAYHLIHAHYVFSGLLAMAQRLPWGLPGPSRETRPLPIVLTHHGIETQWGWTAPLCRWTGRRVARNIATSRRVAEGLRLPDVDIVPCGIDADLFRPMPRSEARATLGLPRAGPLVLFAGVRRPEKRFDLVEAAVARLRAARADARLIVADHEPHDKMPLFMNACDALILASQGEGSPMVIKEAMACNLPIVSVDVGDVREVIGGTAGCYLAEPTPESLAERLAQALDFGQTGMPDPDAGRDVLSAPDIPITRRTEGRNAMRSLTLDAIAGRLEAIYRSVLAGRQT